MQQVDAAGEVLPFLARVRARFAVPMLYVTHALDEVDRLADALVLMADGRVLAAGSVLACMMLEHDPWRGLSRLGFAGGTLVVPLQAVPEGERVRVRVRARDVSVATARPEGISVQNVLPATIEAVLPGAPHEAMLRLCVGESALLSRVTSDTVGRLGLAPGRAVWALLKSVSLGDERREV